MNVSSVSSAQQPTSTDGFGQLFKDFKGIGSAIQSGDLTTAASALTSFQNDLQSTTGKNPLSQLFNNNSTLSSDLTSLQNALKSNDPTAAQNAFKTLAKDMQSAMKTGKSHGHHHHKVDNDGDADDGGTNSTATNSTTSGSGAASSSTDVGSTLNVQA